MKILHIGGCDKFLPPLIEFIKENFDFDQHEFLLRSGMGKAPDYPNVKVYERKIIERLKFYIVALLKMHRADKVILHGLFDIKLVFILFFTPWLLRKCYWVMWGGDLYVYQLGDRNWKWRVREFFRRPVIKNIKCFTTTVPGDYKLAQDWYNIKSKWIHNLMYPSHLFRDAETIICNKFDKTETYIQVGNSADPSNNHFEVIESLVKFKNKNIKVFCPLSYGSEQHKHKVIEYGYKLLSDKFIPLTEFMSFEEYNSYMACIDIAIFNHDRQQAMGNIIGLLSLGKKVVMKPSITPFTFFSDMAGIKIYTIDDPNLLESLNKQESFNNIQKMKSYFNKERLRMNWTDVFDDE